MSYSEDKKNIAAGKTSHKWMDVKKYILDEISNGSYLINQVIPSEAYIANNATASRNTVRQALKSLEDEGIVYRIKGKGTFLSRVPSPNRISKVELFGLILPDLRRSIYPSIIQGFDDRLLIENFQTIVCQSGNNVDRQANAVMSLLYKSIDGLAIVPATIDPTPAYQIQMLVDSNIPVVLCHRAVKGVNVPVLYWDIEDVGRMAGEILIKHGHRNIGYYGIFKYHLSQTHLKGLRSALAAAGLELPDSSVLFGPDIKTPDAEAQRSLMLKDFLLKTTATAIFCSDDDEAERLYWEARSCGINVPDDLSIIGFGESHRLTATKKFISSIVLDEYDLGRQAADLLCEMKIHGSTSKEGLNIPLKLHVYEGSSIAKI